MRVVNITGNDTDVHARVRRFVVAFDYYSWHSAFIV